MTTILVTSLIDIGRGQWTNKWKRDFSVYLRNFRNVCQLDNYMVIWVTKDLVETVREFREGKEDKTSIQVCRIEDYHLYKYRDKFDDIIEYNKSRNWSHDDAPSAIEFTIPMYDLVVNNKVEFVCKTKDLKVFSESDNDTYYTWIDAGYGHNTVDFSGKCIDARRNPSNSVYINKLWKWPFEHDWKAFQEVHWPLDIMDGGFVAIPGQMVEKFHKAYYDLIKKGIDQKILDDDQFFMTMLYVERPELFSVQEGEWFGALSIYMEDVL